MLKYLMIALLALTMNALAIIISSQTLICPEGKKTVYFINDVHYAHERTVQDQFLAIKQMLAESPDSLICCDSFVKFDNYSSVDSENLHPESLYELDVWNLNRAFPVDYKKTCSPQNALHELRVSQILVDKQLLQGSKNYSLFENLISELQNREGLLDDPRSRIEYKDFYNSEMFMIQEEKIRDLLQKLMVQILPKKDLFFFSINKQEIELVDSLMHALNTTKRSLLELSFSSHPDLFDYQTIETILNSKNDSIIVFAGAIHSAKIIPLLKNLGYKVIDSIGIDLDSETVNAKASTICGIFNNLYKSVPLSLLYDYLKARLTSNCSERLLEYCHSKVLQAVIDIFCNPLTPDQIISIFNTQK